MADHPLTKYRMFTDTDGHPSLTTEDVDHPYVGARVYLASEVEARIAHLEAQLKECERENDELTQVCQNFEASDLAKMTRIRELETQLGAQGEELERLTKELETERKC